MMLGGFAPGALARCALPSLPPTLPLPPNRGNHDARSRATRTTTCCRDTLTSAHPPSVPPLSSPPYRLLYRSRTTRTTTCCGRPRWRSFPPSKSCCTCTPCTMSRCATSSRWVGRYMRYDGRYCTAVGGAAAGGAAAGGAAWAVKHGRDCSGRCCSGRHAYCSPQADFEGLDKGSGGTWPCCDARPLPCVSSRRLSILPPLCAPPLLSSLPPQFGADFHDLPRLARAACLTHPLNRLAPFSLLLQ